MGRGSQFLKIASVIILGVLVQAVLIFADKVDAPDKAAREFTKAYFMLDRSMAERLCRALTADQEVDVVEDYLRRVADDARASGFKVNYMRTYFAHLESETYMNNEAVAEVRITGARRRCINPIYATVARLFFIGETYPVDETLTVVKENGYWKVCGQPFALVESRPHAALMAAD
ncbi:MAG: hypothetical protein JSW39_29405 [Desulfobacterales bacterium]|nr:MAG: hypothetical protein JSW39_29405 [Desulfobacterales bacterium]